MTSKQFNVLATRLKEELENISNLRKELSGKGLLGPKKRIKSAFTEEDTFMIRAVGSVLHDFYVAAENIFEVVAREIDEKLPAGEQWHRELLLQMTLAIPEVRPPLLSKETAARLDEYRGFRHVFRNVYGFNLSSERIIALVNKFPLMADCLEKKVYSFIRTMSEIIPTETAGEGR